MLIGGMKLVSPPCVRPAETPMSLSSFVIEENQTLLLYSSTDLIYMVYIYSIVIEHEVKHLAKTFSTKREDDTP